MYDEFDEDPTNDDRYEVYKPTHNEPSQATLAMQSNLHYNKQKGRDSLGSVHQSRAIKAQPKPSPSNDHPYRSKVSSSAIIPKNDRPVNGWGRFIMSRSPLSHFETEINDQFDRAFVGVNFDSEKARYLKMWADNLLLLEE